MPDPDHVLVDEAVVQQLGQHDEQALAVLYDRYADLIFTLALRIVGDRQLAEEVVQDTFLRCWDGIETYHASRGRVAAWLIGIARNRAIDLLRSRSHQARLREHAALPGDDEPQAPSVADAAEALDLRHTVVAALHQLPRAQRQVVELAYYGGLTQGEIAHYLGEPLGTIKTRTRTALERLRTALRPYFDLVAEDEDAR